MSVAFMAAVAWLAVGVGDESAWSGYGGNRGDFRLPADHRLSVWGDGGPTVAWRAPVGKGSSSPAVDDESVYVFASRPGEGDGWEEGLICFDRSTGEVEWETWEPVQRDPSQETMGGDGPHATPTLCGDAVLTVGYGGDVLARDRITGDVLWEKSATGAWDAPPVQFGSAASILVVDDWVVVFCGGDTGVRALDAKTGETVWASDAFVASYVTPVLATGDDGRFLLVVGRDDIAGLDVETGERLWTVPQREAGLTNFSAPLWQDGRYLLLGGQGSKGMRMLERSEDGLVELWFERRIGFSHRAPVCRDDTVFMSSGMLLQAFDWRSGEMLWRERGFPECTVLLGEERSLLLDESGILRWVTMTRDGITVLAEAEILAEKVWASPAVSAGWLFARNNTEVVALDLRDPADRKG